MASDLPPGFSDDAVGAHIEKEYKGEIRACEELRNFALARFEPWSGRAIEDGALPGVLSADQIIAMELGRSTKTYRASLALARQGYAEQAAMLNRSLFEGMAVAHWVHSNEAEARERFHRAVRFDEHLRMTLLRNVGWLEEEEENGDSEINPSELDELARDFGKYGERMWTGHSGLRGLIEDIEDQWTTDHSRKTLWDFLRVAHRDNNQMLHSTVSGLASAASMNTRDGFRLWAGPSNVRIDTALFGTYWIYSNTFTLVMERFELPGEDEFQTMVARQEFDFFRFTAGEVKDVGRNDPCPCGSKKKFKKCHWDQVHAA